MFYLANWNIFSIFAHVKPKNVSVMCNRVKLFMSACVCACALFAAFSCSDNDDFFSKEKDSMGKNANLFDFSTTQKVDLIVDYSSFKTYGSVWFSIYSVNPIINENTGLDYVNESIEPLFQAYTDAKGKFDATISLPAYAKVLHVVTGDFMIGLRRDIVEVVNGEARIKVEKQTPAKSRVTRAPGAGTSTNDLTKMYNISYIINHSTGAKTGERIYNDWHTPLGTWNSATGRPDYLLDKATASPGLCFTDEEFNGLYETAKTALNSGTTCKEIYRASADLTLIKDSEVSITALGSMTCWNSSLGYYYYTADNPPTSPSDLNIIMLFPNTQDGQRDLSWDYQNNIGTVRGDVVQLIYYPNIAQGSYSGSTTTFPKGTIIGFILKPNGWAGQGNDYCSKKTSTYFWNKKLNIWAASTEGLSYCRNNGYNFPNPNGEARSAKFQYRSPEGNNYAIVSFEDACDDQDYDDLLFALNPKNAFLELAAVEENKTTTHGVYAFEDMWPARGDYDMNDVMVDYQQEITFKSGKVKNQVFSLTTYQNFVTLKSGLALKLNKKTNPSKIVLKKKAPGQSDAVTANFTKDGDYYYLTDDITDELNTTYIIELTYSTAQELSNIAEIEPFLYRVEDDGKQWEVHLPSKAPTNKMNTAYFGTGDDASGDGRYFVRPGNYPFAFYMENAKIEYFEDILKRENESRPIDAFFPEFIEWSTSQGKLNANWYMHPAGL